MCSGGWIISLTLKCDSTSLKYTQLLFSNPIDYKRFVVFFRFFLKRICFFKLETSKFIVKFSHNLGLVF